MHVSNKFRQIIINRNIRTQRNVEVIFSYAIYINLFFSLGWTILAYNAWFCHSMMEQCRPQFACVCVCDVHVHIIDYGNGIQNSLFKWFYFILDWEGHFTTDAHIPLFHRFPSVYIENCVKHIICFLRFFSPLQIASSTKKFILWCGILIHPNKRMSSMFNLHTGYLKYFFFVFVWYIYILHVRKSKLVNTYGKWWFLNMFHEYCLWHELFNWI